MNSAHLIQVYLVVIVYNALVWPTYIIQLYPVTSAYRDLANPYTLFGCTQCVPRTYKPLHLIRVYPVTSAYRGLTNPYTLFRCTQ